MYKASPESEGTRVAWQETLGYGTALAVVGAGTCAGSAAIEAALLSRLQKTTTSRPALEVFQSPQLNKYLKTFFSQPFLSMDDRRKVWETLTGEKISNIEEARHVLKKMSRIRRITIGTISVLAMMEAYRAYQKGYNAFNEQLLSGIAPFYLTPQCVPSRGTLSIRLLKDNSSLPLPECILPVAIHESPFARRYDPSNIGILPIERRTAPFLVSQAIQEYQQSLPNNKRHTGVRKVIIQSSDLSVGTDPLSQQTDLNRNFAIGNEIKIRLRSFMDGNQHNSPSSSGSNIQDLLSTQPQFHHVHLMMSNGLQQVWQLPSSFTHAQTAASSTSSIVKRPSLSESNNKDNDENSEDADRDLFLIAMLRSLFPTLPLMKEFATSEEGKRINELIRTAYFHYQGGSDGQSVHLHLLDVRPLVVSQLITLLLTTLPIPQREESDNIDDSEQEDDEEDKQSLYEYFSSKGMYFYENCIEPWDFLWDLSVLSAKVTSKYLLIVTDTIGSMVRASALDPMLGVDDSNLVVQEKLIDIGLKAGIASNVIAESSLSRSGAKATETTQQPQSKSKDDAPPQPSTPLAAARSMANSSNTGTAKGSKPLMKPSRGAPGGVEEDKLIGLVPRATEVNRLSALFNQQNTMIYYDDISSRGSTTASMNLVQNAIVNSSKDSILGSVLSDVFAGSRLNVSLSASYNSSSSESIAPSTILDQQYLVHGLRQVGLTVSPLSELEVVLSKFVSSLPATLVPPVDVTVPSSQQRTWLQFFGRTSWQCLNFTFQHFRTSCVFIHDLLADVSGIDHPSRRRKLLLQQQQTTDGQQSDGELQTHDSAAVVAIDANNKPVKEKKTKKVSKEAAAVPANRVIVTVVGNAEEIPYRLYMLTHRFPDCHIALVLSSDFPQPMDAYTQSLIKTSIAQYSGISAKTSDGKQIILINPHEVADKLWNALPV